MPCLWERDSSEGDRNGLMGKEEGLFSVAFYLFNVLGEWENCL